MEKSQILKIKKTFTKPFIYLFIFWFSLFLFVNIYFNEIYVIWLAMFNYWAKIYVPYVFFTFVNTFLVALSLSLLTFKLKEIRSMSRKWWFFWTIWTFFALLTWACPGCIAWIFPAFMGIFGYNFALISLPFNWLELQVASFVFLLIWIYFLSKDITCKIKINK